MIDLNKIANSHGFGSGAKAIADQKVKDDAIASLPNPTLMATLYPRTQMQGCLVATLGLCPDTNEDWVLEHESELGLVDGDADTASRNALSIAAVWNAYRNGLLALKSEDSPK